jgi:hypothetical protein
MMMRVEPTGIEPVTGSPQAQSYAAIAPSATQTLAQTLARNSQIDPTLAGIVAAWPMLPEAIRKAMLALAESGQ